jgi:hypothetical protein
MAMSTRHGKPRDPEREQFWRRTVADHAQSNLTIKAYCRRKSLSPATFRFWQRELARRDAESTSRPTAERSASSTELSRTPAFLPVRVVEDAAAPMTTSSPIEIVLPSGPIVRITDGFNPQALDAVLSVLEARSC